MSNPYFRFKQFTVFQDKCAMKVGIDGVLLGAWTPIENAHKILDIGTGTGLIALMLAQRSQAEITAIDIDQGAVLQTTENVKNSPWENSITVLGKSLQLFAADTSERFDLIVSNPPYFINSMKTPVESRTTARHTDSMTHEELIENAKKLLNPFGRICIILPINEGKHCVEFAEKKDLFCTKQVLVFPKPNVLPKRLLLEFSLLKSSKLNSELIIESEERHNYTPQFKALSKDFYLK